MTTVKINKLFKSIFNIAISSLVKLHIKSLVFVVIIDFIDNFSYITWKRLV